MRRARVCAAAFGAAVGWGEWLNRRWSQTLVDRDSGVGSEVVVVLGFRNRGARLNLVNRSRVRIGLRSVTGDPGDSVVVFSGGAVAHTRPEARLMAAYATSALGFRGRVLIEDRSRSTWENVLNVIEFLEDFDRIRIASQPAHALKARAYLGRQRPDLAARLVPARDHRIGDWFPLEPLLAAYGLWTLRRLTADERPHVLPRFT